ncbi:MAG: hypothetical protein ABIR54_09385 [Burkholderiaceae bacterium]
MKSAPAKLLKSRLTSVAAVGRMQPLRIFFHVLDRTNSLTGWYSILDARDNQASGALAPRSSVAKWNAGTAARLSRQAHHPANAMAAGIDAASMARRCQTPF